MNFFLGEERVRGKETLLPAKPNLVWVPAVPAKTTFRYSLLPSFGNTTIGFQPLASSGVMWA